MKTKQENLDEILIKCYVKQLSCGMDLTGVEIRSAANTTAKKIEIQFKATDVWQ
jgi:hypothetical protein